MAQWPSGTIVVTVADGELYLAALALLVTITSPTEGATVVSASVPVQWSYAPGTQQTARLRVYTTLALVEPPLYDSGITATSAKTLTIPDGVLSTPATYYMVVDITTTAGQTGRSAVRTFLTNFAPTNTIPAPTVTVTGDCPTPADRELPAAIVHWTAPVLAANETFTRYSVLRRRRPRPDQLATADDEWTRIASETSIATLSYADYDVGLRSVWEYDVTFSVLNTATGNNLTSVRHASVPHAYIDNPWTYLHDHDDPTQYVAFYHFDGTIEPVDDIAEVQFWGNTKAVLFVGDVAYDRIRLPGLPDIARGRVWEQLTALRQAQRVDGATLMLRIGEQGKRYYCGAARMTQELHQGSYEPNLDLVEVEGPAEVA